MLLTTAQVEEFRSLYRQHFAEELFYDEAYEQATKLLRLVELVYRPISEEEFQVLQKRRKATNYSLPK